VNELEGHARRTVEEAALQGDRRALDALWQMNRRWVAAVLLAYKPRSHDLEDLLQEVAMTLLTKISTVRRAGNIRAWLRTVAINAARAAGRADRARSAHNLDSTHADLAHTGLNTAGHSLAHVGFEVNDEARRAMRLCEGLPDGYREPLLLKAVHGLRTRQISELLDLPEATVDTRISRARRMLRDQIGPAPQGHEPPLPASTHPRSSASPPSGSLESVTASVALTP
jgi:RNA polymerase sigma-70 factor (ECF subfamily)